LTTGVSLEGQGLHSGARCRISFTREPGPVRLRLGDACVRLDELAFDGASRSTHASTIDGRVRIGTVEHLFAALGGMSIRDGVVVEMDGPEVPLVDGGARAFVDALDRLALQSARSSLVVARDGTIEVGRSVYAFSRRDAVHVAVEIDFDDARLEANAEWQGDAADFRERIAPARTFGFAHEVDALAARGLASHVAPESVVVITTDGVLSAGSRFRPDEPARHKLLDLVGDLYAHGGPPVGSVRAVRPGHAATHEAVRRALAEDLLVVDRASANVEPVIQKADAQR
jgi:UDP-3-O-[3-hydroxymyristoyl] N-acetylglucosamine deacetylase